MALSDSFIESTVSMFKDSITAYINEDVKLAKSVCERDSIVDNVGDNILRGSAYYLGKKYHYVIAVCDETNAQTCPIFPGILMKTIHWSFEDPASFQGSWEEKLAKTRQVRDEIEAKIKEWLKSLR